MAASPAELGGLPLVLDFRYGTNVLNYRSRAMSVFEFRGNMDRRAID